VCVRARTYGMCGGSGKWQNRQIRKMLNKGLALVAADFWFGMGRRFAFRLLFLCYELYAPCFVCVWCVGYFRGCFVVVVSG